MEQALRKYGGIRARPTPTRVFSLTERPKLTDYTSTLHKKHKKQFMKDAQERT
jgi:hypothetical protein